MTAGEQAIRRNRGRCICAFAIYIIGYIAIFFAGAGGSEGQSPTPLSEYQVKAAFLFHFAQMVEWPADTLGPDTRPMIFCTTGEDGIAAALEAIVPGKQIATHPIELRRVNSKADFQDCHLVFIGGRDSRRALSIVNRLQDSSVLLVGESEGFAQQGGAIEFLLQNNKVRFDINVSAAQRARLKISSRLLLLARTVIDSGKAG